MAEPDPLRPMRDIDQAQLEAWASGLPIFGAVDPARTGQARYELRLRDQEYAEQQETSRREFETALADKQLRAATDVARATWWAMWAAGLAAAGAIVQAAMAVVSYLR